MPLALLQQDLLKCCSDSSEFFQQNFYFLQLFLCVVQFLTALLALSAGLLISGFCSHESQTTEQNQGMPKTQAVKFSLQGKAPDNSGWIQNFLEWISHKNVRVTHSPKCFNKWIMMQKGFRAPLFSPSLFLFFNIWQQIITISETIN